MSDTASGQAVVRLDRDAAMRVVDDWNGSATAVDNVAATLHEIGLGDFAPLFMRWSDATRDCARAVSVAIDGTALTDYAAAAAMTQEMP